MKYWSRRGNMCTDEVAEKFLTDGTERAQIGLA